MKPGKKHIRPLIVIPAFNEADRIGGLLHKLETRKNHLIVIDDGSTDATAGLVSGLGFLCHSLPENKGLTGAYAFAEQYAQENDFSHILAIDADGQHDPRYIPAFLERMEQYDLVSGNRFHDPGLLPDPKIASNLFAILLFREVLGILLPDVACGFRGWKTGLFPAGGEDSEQPGINRRFGIIYRMLMQYYLDGYSTGFVNIPAIYHANDPLDTKIPEILGLLSSVLRYKKSEEIQSLMEHVLNKRNFTINLSGFTFDASLVSDEAYVFGTDAVHARLIFTTIQNQVLNGQKS